MKKTKLLIPALGVASVGAVVAPMMTMSSCSKEKVVVSTDDVNFKGEQHAAVTGGWTIDQANTEYRKDSKYVAEDTVAALGYQAKSDLEDTKGEKYKNVKISSFNASISNLSASEKNAKVNYEMLPNKGEIKGQLVSAKVNAKYTICYDYVLDSEEKKILKNIHCEDAYEISYDIKDCFAFLGLNLFPNSDGTYSNHFTLNLYGSKNASENWLLHKDYKKFRTTIYTLKDDDTITDTEVRDEYHETYNAKLGSDMPLEDMGNGLERYAYLPSSYLSKVTWKPEAMPMGYRDDEDIQEILSKLGVQWVYVASPIMLTPGTEYTFYVDVKADDKIQLFHPGYSDELSFVTNYPTFKIDGVADTATWAQDPSGSGAYVRTDGTTTLLPITKDCRLSVTFKIDATKHTEGDLQMMPLCAHYEPQP